MDLHVHWRQGGVTETLATLRGAALRGPHNALNMTAALAAVRWVGAQGPALQKCLENFYKYAPAMSKDLIAGHYVEALNLLIDEGVKRNGLGWMDDKKMNNTIDLVTKYTPLKKRIDAKDLYTNKFLPQAGKM